MPKRWFPNFCSWFSRCFAGCCRFAVHELRPLKSPFLQIRRAGVSLLGAAKVRILRYLSDISVTFRQTQRLTTVVVFSVRLWLGKIRPNLLCRYVSCNLCFRSLWLWRAQRSCTFVCHILGWTPESGIWLEYFNHLCCPRPHVQLFLFLISVSSWFHWKHQSRSLSVAVTQVDHIRLQQYLTQLMGGTEIGYSRSPLWFHLLK